MGKNDAPVMGKFLFKKDILPDLIICSPALRTSMTLELVLKGMGEKMLVVFNKLLYEGSVSEILEIISQTDNGINSLMIIGHNPSIQNLAECFINGTFPYNKFSTSGIAIFEFEIDDWKKIFDKFGKLVLFKTPKMMID